MASLDINPQIGRAYQTLISSPAPANKSPTYAQWAVFAVSAPLQNAFITSSGSKASTLKVHSTGGIIDFFLLVATIIYRSPDLHGPKVSLCIEIGLIFP